MPPIAMLPFSSTTRVRSRKLLGSAIVPATRSSKQQLEAILLVRLAIICAICSGALVSAATIPTTIQLSVNNLYVPFVTKSHTAYALDHPALADVAITSSAGAGGIADALSKKFDFVITTNSLPTSAQPRLPNVRSYPFSASAIAPFYNLPASVGSASLVLTRQAVCRIWRKNITSWDDPAIVATNPTLTLPGHIIVIVLFNFPNEANTAASRMCTKVDPGWASGAGLGVTSLPAIPAPFIPISAAQGGNGLGSTIVDTPWSIGWGGAPTMATIVSLKAVSLVNQAGKIMQPTPAAAAQTFLELSANGFLPDGSGYDLTNPQSAFAWPVCQSAWLLIDVTATQSTCATKKALLDFILFFYTSSVVSTLALSANLALLPTTYLDQSSLLDHMRAQIQCAGSQLLTTATTTARFHGNAVVQESMTLFTELYAGLDSSFTYVYSQADDGLALSRVTAAEIDFAVVDPSALTDAQIDAFTATYAEDPVSATDSDGSREEAAAEKVMRPGGMIIPAYLTGVVPIYTLPTSITALAATWSTTTPLGLPALYPLVVDMQLVVKLFTGQIRSWLQKEMLLLNPQLAPWFNRTAANPTLRTVACCTGTSDPGVASTTFIRALLRTQNITASTTAQSQVSQLNYFELIAPYTFGQMSVIESEARLPAKISMQPGSVSYRLINTERPASSGEFHFRFIPDGQTQTVTVAPGVESLLACARAKVSTPEQFASYISSAKGRDWSNQPKMAGCWPITSQISYAVPGFHTDVYAIAAAATGGASSQNTISATGTIQTATSISAVKLGGCSRAKHALKLLQWLQTDPVMTSATNQNGLVRLGDLDEIGAYIETQLNSATCDGLNILITLPTLWIPDGSSYSLSEAATIIGCLMCAVTFFMLWRYRLHPMIRSSSPFFMGFTAVGMMVLVISLPYWASPASDSNCRTFQWMANIGFSLTFAPLFAKTWRIYAIFNAKKIKVVKISNSRLLWMVLATLAFELVFNAIWTGVSPLRPITYRQYSKGDSGEDLILELTHCSVDDVGFVFIAVEAVVKAGLLGFGALMSYTTRNVASAFNESSLIAYSVYNCIFSGAIIAGIIGFISTLGDKLIILVLLLLIWIVFTTWALVFGPKFYALFIADSPNAEGPIDGGSTRGSLAGSIGMTNSNGSHLSRAAGAGADDSEMSKYQFLPFLSLPQGQLASYAKALEMQLERVKRRLVSMAAFDKVQQTPSEGAVLLGGAGGRRVARGNSGLHEIGSPSRPPSRPASSLGTHSNTTFTLGPAAGAAVAAGDSATPSPSSVLSPKQTADTSLALFAAASLAVPHGTSRSNRAEDDSKQPAVLSPPKRRNSVPKQTQSPSGHRLGVKSVHPPVRHHSITNGMSTNVLSLNSPPESRRHVSIDIPAEALKLALAPDSSPSSSPRKYIPVHRTASPKSSPAKAMNWNTAGDEAEASRSGATSPTHAYPAGSPNALSPTEVSGQFTSRSQVHRPADFDLGPSLLNPKDQLASPTSVMGSPAASPTPALVDLMSITMHPMGLPPRPPAANAHTLNDATSPTLSALSVRSPSPTLGGPNVARVSNAAKPSSRATSGVLSKH